MAAAQSETIKKNRKLTVGLAVACVILVVGALMTYWSGYPRYLYYVSKCGGQPVIGDYNPLFGGGVKYQYYTIPGSHEYKVALSNKYYCSEHDAQADGLKRLLYQ